MNHIIEVCLSRSRTVLLTLVFFLVAGSYAYLSMPKEATPDISIPIIFVSMELRGISPEDGERLLVRPMEKELRGIEGVKEMRSKAIEGSASVTLEFDAGFDKDKALADVREKVDIARPELPNEAEEPIVNEVSFSLFPVIVVGLSGNIPEHTLNRLARGLRDKIEEIPQVLNVDIVGTREDLVEILIKPEVFESYHLQLDQIFPRIIRNNKLVAAGTLNIGEGRFPVKVPGLYEKPEDILTTPIKVHGDSVLSMQDLTVLRKSFKDATSYARIAGKPSITLEVKKRTGENIIETTNRVRQIVAEESQEWPENIEITFMQDNSKQIRTMLADLQNNLISAVILVMGVIFLTLGWRTSLLVGLAIPGSFLSSLYALHLAGITINNVVLFSLILSVGMLVDGAIVITEFADRKMAEGICKSTAYLQASQRMVWPVTSSTATTLAAFTPLLFWPGVVGQFMQYLPITLITTLTASLVMAIIFVPTLGGLIGKPGAGNPRVLKHLNASETGDLSELGGVLGWYIRNLKSFIKTPLKILIIAIVTLILVYTAKIFFGKGVEFFPNVEPDRTLVQMHVRGNLSLDKMDRLLREVEARLIGINEFQSVYANSRLNWNSPEFSDDVHGVVSIEFIDWEKRRPTQFILDDMEKRLEDLAGMIIEFRKEKPGPPIGKPIFIELSSNYPERLEPELKKILQKLKSIKGLKGIEDSRPEPGIEWQMTVNREQASRFGADIQSVGDVIQLVTNGLKIGSYRPNDSDDEVDINVRYPITSRHLLQLNELHIPTSQGSVPISSFVKQEAVPKLGKVDRTNGKRVLTIKADVQEGILPDDKVQEIQAWLKTIDVDPRVSIAFKGEDKEQQEAKAFLLRAFIVALSLMSIILVTQFNSFYQAFLVLTAVVFSTVGVFLGLLITRQPFGIIMNGIGVISLAGIVVNNNIVLIDTFDRIKETCHNTHDAILRTCAQRFRPVMLTTITTILGLLPMVFGVNIDFLNLNISVGAPSTQWWKQLATSIAFGLFFATFLTLILTPCLLSLGDYLEKRWDQYKK